MFLCAKYILHLYFGVLKPRFFFTLGYAQYQINSLLLCHQVSLFILNTNVRLPNVTHVFIERFSFVCLTKYFLMETIETRTSLVTLKMFQTVFLVSFMSFLTLI
jgi:hypothetical protein